MGKIRSKKFFAHQQFNLKKRKERDEKKEKQRQQQQQQQLQEEAAEAHEEVERLEEEIRFLQRSLVDSQDRNDALNQLESNRLHEEIRRLQANATRRSTRKRT